MTRTEQNKLLEKSYIAGGEERLLLSVKAFCQHSIIVLRPEKDMLLLVDAHFSNCCFPSFASQCRLINVNDRLKVAFQLQSRRISRASASSE